jgi:hypothetical protein
LVMLRNVGSAALVKHARAVLDRLDDTEEFGDPTVIWISHISVGHNADMPMPERRFLFGNSMRDVATRTLRALPGSVTRDVDFEAANLRSRLLGRAGWYRCRLLMRLKRIALYWYSLPYRPGGPGHARDVEAWGRMLDHQYHRKTTTRKKRHVTDMDEGRRRNRRKLRSTKRMK